MQGILVVNKRQGITSHDCIYILRDLLGIKKIGHSGTLDPMATGVLPMTIGKATRVSSFIQDSEKEYIATIEFGIETDTEDITGNIINRSDKIPTKEEILEILPKFTGVIEQTPPMYSAVRLGGRKLYKIAREGKVVDRPKRKVKIYGLELLGTNPYKVKINCSSGTYVRTLISDIGKSLVTFATMTSLVRTKVGPFTVEKAITIDDLENMTKEEIEEKFYPTEFALRNMPRYNVPKSFFERLINGVKFFDNRMEDGKYSVYCRDEFIGIGEFIDGRLRIKVLRWR